MISFLGKRPGQAVQAATPITFSGLELADNPTDESSTILLVLDSTVEYHYQFGTSTGSYPNQTSTLTVTWEQPHEIVIDGLTAHTKYFYRMRYHA